jgi:hypothetical protein
MTSVDVVREDQEFLDDPYNPLYSIFGARPVLVKQFVLYSIFEY